MKTSTAPLILSVPLTHSDWMLRPNIPWGAAGIRYMLDQCKAGGWTRVYWRLFDGGRTVYASKLADPMGEWDDDNYWNPQNPDDMRYVYWKDNPDIDAENIRRGLGQLDYSHFDTLTAAIDYGHSIGLEIHAWISINEDDHAWGLQSIFTKNNPQSRWRKRDGTFYHSQQSFSFPEVREYKLALIQEVLNNFDIDGIFLDWMRTGDVRDDPQQDENGVADFGYEEPLVQSFKERYGIDPHDLSNGDERWVAWRARPQTEFMRGVRKLMKTTKPQLPLAVMGQHPWSYRGNGHKIDGNLRGLLLDMKTWAKEELMDSAVAAGYYRDDGNAEKAYLWLHDETEGLVEIWVYGWVPDAPADFDRDVELAQCVGAQQILYWEADYIDTKREKELLQHHMNNIIKQKANQ